MPKKGLESFHEVRLVPLLQDQVVDLSKLVANLAAEKLSITTELEWCCLALT